MPRCNRVKLGDLFTINSKLKNSKLRPGKNVWTIETMTNTLDMRNDKAGRNRGEIDLLSKLSSGKKFNNIADL